MHDLIGKVAVITGGASGIGYALAECFGQQGCHIVLADIEEESLSESVARLRRSGVDARGQVTDVANYDSVLRLRDFVDAIFGPADLLFNNAGVSITGPTWKMSPDDWRWVWDVNVWGVVNGIRAFLPAMLDRGKPGHIINTGSLASFNGNGDHAPYCSSKAAVLGLSQSLFSEMEAMMTGIGVSIICPGMVATRIHQSWRNRPSGHRPWSDREFANPAFVEGSNSFQGRGLSPEVIASATLEAVQNGRFYVFAGDMWPRFMEETVGRAMRGENPLVLTWGDDVRPPEQRTPAPWQSVADPV